MICIASRFIRTAAAVVISAGFLASAHADPAMSVKADNGKTVLQAPDGRSLYVFDGDSAGKSNCEGECLKQWPPFLAVASEQAPADYSRIARPDGSQQWAYKGRPLYLFLRDTKPGETNGNSFNGNKWHLAAP